MRYITVLILFAAFINARAGLKIYYLRHGETGANARRHWRETPREEWPEYIKKGVKSFTPEGDRQVAELPEKLKRYGTFDHIAVSPTWRTCETILGYLKETDRKGEIWADLAEISTDRERSGEPMRPDLFEGEVAKVDDEQLPFFHYRDDARRYVLSIPKLGKRINDVELEALCERIAARVKEACPGEDQSILLVGHGSAGRHLVKYLLGGADLKLASIRNTGVWMVEEQEDGGFRLMMYNDEPIPREGE